MGSLPKLHLGCGLNVQPGWINLDGSLNARLMKHPSLRKLVELLHLAPKSHINIPWSANIVSHDVTKPLPFKDNSMSAVYASHLLEHLYFDDAKKLLKECYRVLAPGGVVRMMVPDLARFAAEYEKSKDDLKADRFMENLSVRGAHAPSGSLLYRYYSTVKDFHTHKWMYDSASLVYRLQEAGFKEVTEKPRHESRITDIGEIEKNSGLCVEGVKTGN